ncbi:MAG: flagellar basal-body rod protein FlgG [bacterium]|jgi:flagellar basal-body rod protein FlgG
MMRALSTAAAGMIAQQLNIDVISNNLANVNTTGFKGSRAEFQDLLYQNLRSPGASVGTGASTPTSVEIGLGSRPVATNTVFNEGALQVTNNPYDMAIGGDGFFKVLMPDGSTSYTRDGAFKIDGQGRLVTSDGYALEPEITVPSDAISDSFTVGKDGSVSIRRPGSSGQEDLGAKITLVRFINPSGLQRIGGNLYQASSASGEAIEADPGTSGLGTIEQKALEMSNVQVVEEMVKLIMAQRAYEVNAKAIQSADDMLGITNNVKK